MYDKRENFPTQSFYTNIITNLKLVNYKLTKL